MKAILMDGKLPVSVFRSDIPCDDDQLMTLCKAVFGKDQRGLKIVMDDANFEDLKLSRGKKSGNFKLTIEPESVMGIKLERSSL